MEDGENYLLKVASCDLRLTSGFDKDISLLGCLHLKRGAWSSRYGRFVSDIRRGKRVSLYSSIYILRNCCCLEGKYEKYYTIIVHITLCNDLLIVHSGARTVSSFSQKLCIIHLSIPRA